MLVIVSETRRKKLRGESRPVTDLFVKQVNAKLAENDVYNTQHKLRPGDDGYRIATHADLVRATGADANAIKHLLGGVRHGTKTTRPKRSKLVDPIATLLGIPLLVTVEVPEDLKRYVEILCTLTKEELSEFFATFAK